MGQQTQGRAIGDDRPEKLRKCLAVFHQRPIKQPNATPGDIGKGFLERTSKSGRVDIQRRGQIVENLQAVERGRVLFQKIKPSRASVRIPGVGVAKRFERDGKWLGGRINLLPALLDFGNRRR